MTQVRRPALGAWGIAGLLLVLVGAAIRIHNAFDYPVGKGFDAEANWEYVELLRSDWTLPAPDALWASAHPPFYYWLAGGTARLLGADASKETVVGAVRLLGSALGLLAIAGTAWLVRRTDPGNPRRAFLAAALLLYLPVHLYTSAMLNEEIVASALASLAAIALALDLTRSDAAAWRGAAVAGLLAGLALLTKLSALLVVGAGAAAYALDGWRRGALGAGLTRGTVFGAIASVVGGWFFARNLLFYGYLYPYQLDVHAVMATMPPGARGVMDYLTLPFATFVTPAPLAPDLLHSVWGGTYTTLWFDGHRHFLPRTGAAVMQAGQWLMVLGVVPTAALVAGVIAASRRTRASTRGADLVLGLLLAVSLVGYVAFTWRNPWFVTVKASYLLGLAVPFAWFASEALARWTRPDRVWSAVVGFTLALLTVAVVLTFTHGLVFEKHDDPGLQWTPILAAPPVTR